MGLVTFIFVCVFVLVVLLGLFFCGEKIDSIQSKDAGSAKLSEKKDVENLAYFSKTALGFYRLMCEKFLYLDKKEEKEELPVEHTEEAGSFPEISEVILPQEEVNDEVITEEKKDVPGQENEIKKEENQDSVGAHYSPDGLRDVLKIVLNEDEKEPKETQKSGKRKKHDLEIEEEEEDKPSELSIALRRFKRRIKKITKEIVSCEVLDFEGVRRCKDAFAAIICLRNGENVTNNTEETVIVRVPEYDCNMALVAILYRIWVANSPKDFLSQIVPKSEPSQDLSESMFYILNEAVILYLFCYFFHQKPQTFAEYETFETSQKQITEILVCSNIHIKSLDKKQIQNAFTQGKMNIVKAEFWKINWFVFPEEFSHFLNISLTLKQQNQLLTHNKCLWKQSVFYLLENSKKRAEMKIKRQKVILKNLERSNKPSLLAFAEVEEHLSRRQKQLLETNKIIQEIASEDIKTNFESLDESVKTTQKLFTGLFNFNKDLTHFS